MNTTHETTPATLEDRWIALLDRIGEAGGPELMAEATDLAFELKQQGARDAFSRLVIGIYDDATFPTVTDAVRVVQVEPVEIDECNHRASARMGVMLDGIAGPDDPPQRGRFADVARSILERELGNDAEADRLEARAVRGSADAAGVLEGLEERVGRLGAEVARLTDLAAQIMADRPES